MPIDTNHPRRLRAVTGARSCFALLAFCFAALPLANMTTAPARGATPEQLDTLPGFKVELVLKADKDKHGSFISLARDHKGRLLLGGQSKQPVTRLTFKDGKITKEEQLKLPVSEVMGMLDAFDSLYVTAAGPKGYGLYRLRDVDGDDQYDSAELLMPGSGGEHGSHGIVLGPDEKIYVVNGNFVDVPKTIEPTSPHRNYADDLALPRAEDGNGFGAGRKPPGGFIVRMDRDGKNIELFASGQRNTYDIAFNTDGELFGFDSDMEWDWGTPWYRPTRVFHATSGGDGGFREGTAKWPEYYPDSLPAVINIGIGSPTGVCFGTGAKFPAKYQKAMYILDWSYGRVIAVHMKSQGAGYTATMENFVAPKSLRGKGAKVPLNVTDVTIGDDGALYFTIGGRNTPGALYRVTYTGSESTAAAEPHEKDGADARAARKQLETFHGKPDAKALDAAWAQLGSADRYTRYAARIAIERQPVAEWKDKALAEAKPEAALTALLALARYAPKETQPEIFKALAKFPVAGMSEAQQLEKIRVIEVSLSRQGKPEGDGAKGIADELGALYPAKSFTLNRELSQVLLALSAPDAVAKTVKLLDVAPTQEEQIAYVLALRTVPFGWTPELRKEYFGWFAKDRKGARHPEESLKWFEEAGREYGDGASFPKFIGNLYNDARKTLTPDETTALADVLAAYTPPGEKPKKPVKARPVVKQWQMDDLEPLLPQAAKGRNFARGKEAYEAAQCAACHKLGAEGGATGPDLTAIASRFQRRDILESVVLPSKVISEQYQNMTVKLKDGSDPIDGRILQEDDARIVIQPNPLEPEKKQTIKKADIKSRAPSKLSPMPEGLVNVLTKDEILDLMAYMESGGKKEHPAFAK